MANRRMFSKEIIDSDMFLDMPLSTQALYFHLSMRADDDGFVNNPKKIQRMTGASDDDAKILLAKNFILSFESGVIVIKHWKIHNYIQKDRYKETNYIEEKALLGEKDNGAYTLDTEWIQNGDSGKVRIELGKDNNNKETNTISQSEADATEVSNYLEYKILSLNSNAKTNAKIWVKDIEKAIRIDNRTKEQLINCIDWIYSTGTFWIPNIMSGKKLRDKYDQLFMQMQNKQNNTKTDSRKSFNDLVDEVMNKGVVYDC